MKWDILFSFPAKEAIMPESRVQNAI